MNISKKLSTDGTTGENGTVQASAGGQNMLSLAVCKDVLNTGSLRYDDGEILLIRDFLYRLAGIAEMQCLAQSERAVIPNCNQNQLNNEKSVFVYPVSTGGRRGSNRKRPATAGRKTTGILPGASA